MRLLNNGRALLAVSLAAAAANSLGSFNQRRMERKVARHYGSSKYMPHQGKQECARRVRQMAALNAEPQQ